MSVSKQSGSRSFGGPRASSVFKDIRTSKTGRLLELFITHTPVAMAIFDASTRFLAVNDQWRKDYGLEGYSLEGQSLYEIMPEASQVWRGLIDRCLQGEVITSHNDAFLRRDGRREHVRWALHPWRNNRGAVVGAVLITEIVTEQMRNQEAVRLRDAALASALSPMAMFDMAGNFTYANEAFADMVGYPTPEALYGLAAGSFWVDPDRGDEMWRSLHDTGKWIGVLDTRRADGAIRVIQIAANVVNGAEASPIGIMASCVDLTEQKNAEKALSESRRQLVSLMDNLPGGFAFRCRHDLFWTMEIISQGCQEVLGYPPRDLIHNKTVDYASLIHPEDEASVRQEILAAVNLKRPFQVSYRVITRDGGVKWLMQQGTPQFTRSGEVEALEGVVIDTTERIEATESLELEKDRAELYLDVAASIILAMDARGRVSRFNRKGSEVTGYTESELVTKDWFDVMLAPADRAPAKQAVLGLISSADTSGGAHHEYLETQINTRDGQVRLIGWYFTPITDSSGRITGVLGSGEDLTERRNMERQLLQAQKMQAVGELTGGLAHDFNNLLMAVQGNIEFLTEHLASGSDAAKYAESALKAVSRGADLTQRLLAFSRKQLLRPEATAIDRLVSDMTALLGRTLGANIEIETLLDDGATLAMVDPAQLENALLNLAINARDAMPGGGRLTIEIKNLTMDRGFDGQQVVLEPGAYVVIAVHDTGVGMTPEVLDRVFEPFYSTKETGRGSGLGLSMVYGFVKQSGGHVDIKSTPGKGSSVYLYLPSAKAGDSEIAPADYPSEPVKGGHETILVVEDDVAVRDVIRILLTSLGYQVVVAEHGKAAMEHLHGGLKPDLLLTDIIQPQGINGIELAQEVLRRGTNCAILLMSGFTEDIFNQNSVESTPFPLLRKPFGKNELAIKVRKVLDARPDDSTGNGGMQVAQ